MINYPGDCGTPTSDMLTVKILLNSIVSTPGAKFSSTNIKNFYLNTPLPRYKYLRLRMADLPDEIIEEYQLKVKPIQSGFYMWK